MAVDPRTPCIVGVGSRTWHPADTGDAGAPEPLAMWEDVTRAAVEDSGGALLDRLDAIDIVYCQTWQYDDPVGRLSDRLGVAPRRRHYSGIGGTTPQVLVQEQAARIARGELDVALVVGAEALDTQRRYKKRGERYPYSWKPATRPEFPWEAPFHPAEVAHEVFQAWLTFALFDNARRGRARHRARRVPPCAGGAVAPLHRGRGAEPRGVVPDRAECGRDRHADADQPARGLAVHEVHGLDHGRGHGGRRVRHVGGRGRRARRGARSPGVPAGLAVRHRPGVRGRAP